MAKNRQYETTYITLVDLSDEDRKKIAERVDAVIKGFGGEIIRADEWGKRRLAYAINKQSRGYYTYLRYAAPGETVHELERILRLMDPVLKFLTVKLEEGAEEFQIRPAELDEAPVRRPPPPRRREEVVEEEDEDESDD